MVEAKALGIPASCRDCQIRTLAFLSGRFFFSTEIHRESYLELSQGETTAGADTTVVLDGRASHNGSELVDGSGSEGSSLGLAGCASSRLLTGLFQRVNICVPLLNFEKQRHVRLLVGVSPYLVEVSSNPTLPILAEIYSRSQFLNSMCRRFIGEVVLAHGC